MRDGSWQRTAVASLLICIAGGALLCRGTDGFHALTSEQARRNAIASEPRVIPAVALEDQDGQPFTFGVYRGRPVAVDFVYTQCISVCTLLSAGFQRLDRVERSKTDRDRLQLLSISFDARDTPERLRDYAQRYHADGRSWRFARVRDVRDLPTLLNTFGIVVIPDGRGDYQHNAAVHVLDAGGRLARVLDADASPDAVIRVVRGGR